ncbi:peptide chain release factor 3 [soil metagenome]
MLGPVIETISTDTSSIVIRSEAARRRTFAIISHPDAGKTTLTEKLLLYSGSLELAGSVRARKGGRQTTADWLAIEQERGITVTSTSIQFDHGGCRFNLLDTPGHQDFSEDTYRTLMAADGAVMVLDASRGIERQTLKLFKVCRMRRIPIVTFINKLDHPSREPLGLLDEIEEVLGLQAAPMNWPIGDGVAFQGVYDLEERKVLRYTRTERGERRAPEIEGDLGSAELDSALGDIAAARIGEEIELLQATGAVFDRDRFLANDQTPVFFGSALTNFGVKPFLDALVDLLPPPAARLTEAEGFLEDRTDFSGFVFKIQANMDPRHRDRMAFVRVCSGRFYKDMEVFNPRLGRKVRLTRPHQLFAQERSAAEEAFPGDIVGLINPGLFAIGDTLYDGEPVQFPPIPRFAPEWFGRLENQDTGRHKQFFKGVAQLEEEGAVQVFYPVQGGREPILAAVGELQIDVIVARLESEYGVKSSVYPLPFSAATWIEGDRTAIDSLNLRSRGSLRAEDLNGRPVALFNADWDLRLAEDAHPDVRFKRIGDIETM